MPWNETFYPVAMRHLPPGVRAKAIEIANALLAQHYDEGKAIRIGITKAHAWADRHWKADVVVNSDARWEDTP